jgi:hypothetical protein
VIFRRSSYCSFGNCVEVGFHKSSFCDLLTCVEVGFRKSSSCGNHTCVEVAVSDEVVVRDSKDPNGPVLTFSHDEWYAFIAGVKNGEFDRG